MSHARSRDLFPTDSPVADELLIGRSEAVAGLANALSQGVNQILMGPRRTGKTSVARAALERLRDQDIYVVALDLFGIAGTAELAERLVAACVANRGRGARARGRLKAAGRVATGAVSLTLTAKLQAELGQDVEIGFTPGVAARDPERALDYALRLPQRIAEKDGRQFVLFLDEFQEVGHPRAPFGDADAVTKRMRSILQDSPRVTTLFSGSVEHLMAELFTPSHRAFYRFGQTVTLPPIDRQAWLTGLEARYAADGIPCAAGALAGLVGRTSGHPRSTMLVAQQAHLAVVGRGGELDLAAVDEGWFSALAADSAGHAAECDRLRDFGAAALATAKRLARGERPYSGGATRGAVAGVLDRMVEAGLLAKPGRGDYVFVDPLLADYLARL